MGHLSLEHTWGSSLIGRLVGFAFRTWDDSLVGRGLAAAGRFAGAVFAGSLPGRVWYSNWPDSPSARGAWTGRLVDGLSTAVEGVGRATGPSLGRIWSSSLLVRSGEWAAARVRPFAGSSLLVQTFSGHPYDVALTPAESAPGRVSPLIWALGSLLGLLPLIPTDFRPLGLPVPSPTTLMMLGVWGLAAVWIGGRLIAGEFRWRASAALLPLLIFLLVGVAATVQSVSPADSAMSLLLWLTALLLFWMTLNLVRNSRDAVALLGPILAGAALMAVWALYQVAVPPQIEERWVDPATSGNLVRVFASLGNPNYLAEYMALYLPLGLALWLQQPRHRLVMGAPVALMAVALLLTASRGGWLAFLVAVLVMVVMRAPRLLIFLFIGALLFPTVAPDWILMRLASAINPADTSNLYRLNLWQGVTDMLRRVWVLGSGLGAVAFNKVYQEFMLPEARAAHAHNIYLQMLAETGILGLGAILWSLLAVIRRTFAIGVGRRYPILVAAVPAALVGLLVHGMVEHIWYNPKLLFAFWAVAGVGMGLTLEAGEDAEA